MPAAPQLFDGDFLAVTEAEGRARRYPWLKAQTADAYSRVHRRRYQCAHSAYVPRLHARTSITNLLTRSEDLTHGDHTKTNLTAAANIYANPENGAVTAGRLLETVTNGEHKIGRNHTFASAANHVLAAFARYLDRDWIRLLANDGTEDYEGWFNVRDGTTALYRPVISPTVLNGGFETAGGGGADVFADWTESTAGTSAIVRDTVTKYSGAAACRIDVDASNSVAFVLHAGLQFGRRYRLTFAAKGSVAGSLLAWHAASGGVAVGAITVVALGTDWQLFSYEFTSAGDQLVFVRNAAASQSLWIDDVTLQPVGRRPIIAPALGNGDFETAGGGGADVFADWTESTSGTSAIVRDTVDKYTGNASCRIDVDASNSVAFVLHAGLRFGRRYSLTFAAKGSVAGSLLAWHAASGGVAVGAITVVALGTDWQLFSYEFTSAGDQLVFVRNVAASQSLWIDDVTLTPLDEPALAIQRQPDPAEAWYRCSMVFFPRAAAGSVAIALSNDGSTLSYAGDTAKGVGLDRLELKVADAPGPYVSSPVASRTISAPDGIDEDPFAWLAGESDPIPVTPEDDEAERFFARLPVEQIVPGARWFSRPNLHGLKSGSTFAVSFDEGVSSWLFNSRKSVTGASLIEGATVRRGLPATNVTFTPTSGPTVSFACNSSATAIITAMTGMAGISSVSALVSSGHTTITWYGTMLSVTPPSLVSALFNPTGFCTLVAQGTTTTPDLRLITAASHGASAGQRCAVWNGDNLVGQGVVASVIDTDNFTLLVSELAAPDALITHCAFAPQAAARYANGAKECTARTHHLFYLPGVSALADGSTLASGDDIPLVSTYADAQGWLDQIVAGTAWVPVEAGERFQWEDTSIVSRTVTKLKLSAALDSRTP